MAAEAPRSGVRKYFNTLVRETYEDGAPTSAHLGLETVNNDRWLATQLRKTVINTAFTVSSSGTSALLDFPLYTDWYLSPPVNHLVTAGTQNIKLVLTATIPTGVQVHVRCFCSRLPMLTSEEDALSGGKTFILTGSGVETTYTKDGSNNGNELLVPAVSGLMERFQFAFRVVDNRSLTDASAVVQSQLVSNISQDGLTITTSNGAALNGLPVDLSGYSYALTFTGINMNPQIAWGPTAAASCNQANQMNPALAIGGRSGEVIIRNVVTGSPNYYLTIWEAASTSVYSFCAVEHVRREVP